jgi:death-on-curing family protein
VHSAACNHGFVDGNKRTCLVLLLLLLDRSGYKLSRDGSLETQEAVEAMIVAVAKRQMSFSQVEDWMQERICRK